MTMMQDINVPALDELSLRATLFEPPAPRAAAIVNSATAVPRGFYRAFATYLMHRGVAVLTYDYRGAGDPPQELRRSCARMRDWGERDSPGAIAWMRARYPGLPLHAVGHSVGGHVLLLAPNNCEVSRAVVVAPPLGYWRNARGAERYRIFLLLSIVIPIVTRVFGYFPGRAVKFGEDLAPGVLHEWSRWSRLPDYFFGDATLSGLRNALTLKAPMLMIGLDDDPWATPRGMDALAQRLPNTATTRLDIDPHSAGLRSIGHMGFFRSENGPLLWPHVLRFLNLEQNDDERSA